MECLLQYLDDLDDFFGMIVLAAERIRRSIKTIALLLVTLAIQLFGVMLALAQPPLALGAVSLMSVGLLYRAVVNHTTKPVTAA
jgi:apolipoprotein N-acyltransferase